MIKFAIVGCGRVVKKHIEAIGEIPEAKLVAVCDLDIEKAGKAAKLAGDAKCYSSYDEMLKNEDIDIRNNFV